MIGAGPREVAPGLPRIAHRLTLRKAGRRRTAHLAHRHRYGGRVEALEAAPGIGISLVAGTGVVAGTATAGPEATAGATTAPAAGYVLAGSNEGIFAFSTASFDGSMGGKPLNQPVVELVAKMVGFLEHHRETATPFKWIYDARVAA